MSYTSRNLLTGIAFSTLFCFQVNAKQTRDIGCIVDDVADKKEEVLIGHKETKSEPALPKPCVTQTVIPFASVPPTAGTKNRIAVKNGDYEFSCGGKMKIENYIDKNTCMFNSELPDTLEYFKHCIDMNMDYAYGKEKFGYTAAEAFIELRHKGIWGKAMSAADKDVSGPGAPSIVVLDNTSLGGHSHDTSRTLVWVKEAWLQISPNAVFNASNTDYLHFLKVGWLPFELGRGIALGGVYGAGKELLGFYSYGEDKASPSILLHGQLIKDKLSYDLYYSKFEERGKSFSGNIMPVRKHELDAKPPYMRGDNKDNELFAARLQGVAFDNACGKLSLEPYVFYNIANDQYNDISPDTDTCLGSFGLNLEHAYKNFEWGGEMAFNFGQEKLHAIDKNVLVYKKDHTDGIVKAYNKFITTDVDTYRRPALANTDGRTFASQKYEVGVNDNYTVQTIGGTTFYNRNSTEYRFRPAYTNDLRGWMGVIDGAYTLKEHNLKVALAYAYASGDVNPHEKEIDKTYRGFIGLDEWYSGKRVPSVFLLDQRNSARPLSLTSDSGKYPDKDINVENDISFTDLYSLGGGATWNPVVNNKKIIINPNVLFFWRASDSKKVGSIDARGNVQPSTENASKFMGTELNTIAKCELLKDLTMYGNFAIFVPGQYYKDVAGIPLSGDFFANLDEAIQSRFHPKQFRLSYDTAYHMNIGFEYKF